MPSQQQAAKLLPSELGHQRTNIALGSVQSLPSPSYLLPCYAKFWTIDEHGLAEPWFRFTLNLNLNRLDL